jgi:uncharacterized protein YndB with AHSA1/START domain
MFRHIYSTTITDLSAKRVWSVWSDVDQWHCWQDDIEFARLDGRFQSGSTFKFKPKGGPTMDIELTRVEPNAAFTDLTRFPLARMLDSHELIERDGALEVRTTISLSGPLAFLWRKLVVDRIVSDLPHQTERLLQRARGG